MKSLAERINDLLQDGKSFRVRTRWDGCKILTLFDKVYLYDDYGGFIMELI
jgi:hypothetical protein